MSPSVEPFNEAKYKALMDGLKCKEILLSDTYASTDYFRLEAEYYNSTTVSYRRSLKGKDVALNIQYGTSKFCDEQKDGYPVLRLNELHNAFIDTPQKYCHTLTQDEFEKLRLKKGDVLIIRTNGNPNLVGKAAVVLEDTDYAFASYLYRVNTNEQINPETLVAYLNCRYGRYEIDKNSIKGNQTNFSPAKFCDIVIPHFNKSLQNTIKDSFAKAYQYREESISTFSQVEQFLISAIGFNFESKQSNISIKGLSESYFISGRLDAEYYQPKFDQIESIIKRVEHTTLGDISEIESGEFLSEKLYGNKGLPYIRGTEITSPTVDSQSAIKVDTSIDGLKAIETNDLTFAMIGSVGNVAINRKGVAIVSNNLGSIKLHDKSISNYVLLYLLSDVGQAFFEKYQTRTAQPKIRKEDVAKFIIPVLHKTKIDYISQQVLKSFELKEKTETLVNYAIKAVEIAIEQSEESAEKWLREKVAKLEE